MVVYGLWFPSQQMLLNQACVSFKKPEFIKCRNASFYIEHINQVMADQTLYWVTRQGSDNRRITGVVSVRSF